MVKAPLLTTSVDAGRRFSLSSLNGERAADTARGEFKVSSAPLPRRAPDAPAGPPFASRSKTLAPTETAFRFPAPFSLTEADLDNLSISEWLLEVFALQKKIQLVFDKVSFIHELRRFF